MWKFISIILALFGRRVAAGSLFIVLTERKEIEIKPGFTPKEVWIRPMPSKHNVCIGDVDSFDVKIVPHGFIIIAKLANEFREVQWLAIK